MNSEILKGRVGNLILLALFLLFPARVAADEWLTSLNLALGFKVLDQGQWEPLSTTGEIALMSSLEKESWPAALSLDLFYSRSEIFIYSGESGYQAADGFGGIFIAPHEHIDLNVRTWEIDLGTKKIWRGFETVRPYLNGGLALIGAEGEMTLADRQYSNNGSSLGVWAGAGANLVFNEGLNIAFEIRKSMATTDMSIGPPVKAGGMHYHFLIGGNW